MAKETLISLVVPVYNEASGLLAFHVNLKQALEGIKGHRFEIIYCNDGSTDETSLIIKKWCESETNTKLISLSRNFGKENALAAGIAQASGEAIITIDGDGQHPVETIPKLIEAWEKGAQVVVGVRSEYADKRLSSKIFSWIFGKVAKQPILPDSTDFRLIDKDVREAFLSLEESNRINRGLIDWLGFKRELVYFKTNKRLSGKASYSRKKLISLAVSSFVSLSPRPLYMFGYLGIFITSTSFILGMAVLIEQVIAGDPYHWRFTGTAMLSILLLFLVGIILMYQGIVSLYLSHIHDQTKKRPLYIINYADSEGLKRK
jgi:glycosyltransferase involved in cell wall biosynthesis